MNHNDCIDSLRTVEFLELDVVDHNDCIDSLRTIEFLELGLYCKCMDQYSAFGLQSWVARFVFRGTLPVEATG